MDLSNSSTKKSEDINVLTDKVVFRSGIFNKKFSLDKNELNNNIKNNKEKINKLNIDNNNNDNDNDYNKIENNLSFPKKNYLNDILYLNNKVINILKNHEIKKPIKSEIENQKNFKKLFKKTLEKEIEIFESENYEFPKNETNSNNNSFSDKNLNLDNKILKKSDSYSSLNNNLNRNSFDSDDENNGNNKYLNKVICTLSKIENGNATFVSSDDLIFILPSLFIPKDLNIGSTYIFKLYEVNQAENKQEKIQLIHSSLAKENIEDENKIEEVKEEFEQTEPDNN